MWPEMHFALSMPFKQKRFVVKGEIILSASEFVLRLYNNFFFTVAGALKIRRLSPAAVLRPK